MTSILCYKKQEELDYLRKRNKELLALEEAGVNNWEGYSEAMQLLEEWEDEENVLFHAGR